MSGAANIPVTVANALSEEDFQKQVYDLATLYGWKAFHVHDSRREVKPGVFVGDKDARGFPDWLFARPPELLVVELKREAGRLSEPQRLWLTTLEACGVECAVWRPSDWPVIEKRLSRRFAST